MQLRYGYATPAGIAGGLKDLSNYDIVTRLNTEESGVLKFGLGVVQAGENEIKIPEQDSTVAVFEGVTMNGFTTEQNMEGSINILKNSSVGILNYGKAWVRVSPGGNIQYGKDVYLISDGNYRGYFTTQEDQATKLAIKARWIGDKVGGIAPIELFNQKQ